MKKFVCVVLFCAVIFTLSGCSSIFGSETNSSDSNITESKSVTVTLNPNGGSGVTKLALIGVAGTSMELPNPERTGYNFDAWYNGWDIVDNMVFPQSDLTLTARYYALSDANKIVNATPTELNEVFTAGAAFTVAHGELSYSYSEDDFDDLKKIDYLMKYTNTLIAVYAKFECRISKWDATFKLTGSSSADIIQTATNSYSDQWKEITLPGNAYSSVLVGSNDKVLRLFCDANLGSTYIYIRNVTISISYTEKAGTLV